jgi:DNA-binding NarL/FixJ family response regulator
LQPAQKVVECEVPRVAAALPAGAICVTTLKPIRILLADDHPLVLVSVRAVLEEAEFEVVGEAQSGSQVLPLVSRTAPDVVLLDLIMPGMDGLQVLELLTRTRPGLPVIVFSACAEEEQVDLALRRGAHAYVVKTLATADLPALLRQLLSGAVFHPPAAWRELAGEGAVRAAGLSAKELAVLEGVAEGLSNREIAQRLWLSVETVKSHLSNIYRKLDVTSRTAATRVAYERQLLQRSASG